MNVNKFFSGVFFKPVFSASIMVLIATIFTAFPLVGALAHEIIFKNLTIYHPYLLIDEKNKAYGLLSIENHGSESEYLIKISSNFSRSYKIRRAQLNNDTLTPFDLSEGLEIPPGDAIHFDAEELELQFLALEEDLDWFDPHTAIFVFRKSGALELEFEVEIP